MNYKVRNDFLLVKNLQESSEEKKATTGIFLPGDSKVSDFIELEVLEVGPKVDGVARGDIVLAEKMFVPLDYGDKTIGLIREEYVHLVKNAR